MIRRRKFELWAADMWRLLADPTIEDRGNELWRTSSDLRSFDRVLVQDADKMRTVLALAKACREAAGPGRTVAEEDFLRHLSYLTRECVDRLEAVGVTRLPNLEATVELTPASEQTLEVVRLLSDFALESLRYVRSRDTFSGRRRAEAFGMLRKIGYLFDLPEAVELAEQAVRRGGRGDAGAAEEFLEHYFGARNSEPEAS